LEGHQFDFIFAAEKDPAAHRAAERRNIVHLPGENFQVGSDGQWEDQGKHAPLSFEQTFVPKTETNGDGTSRMREVRKGKKQK